MFNISYNKIYLINIIVSLVLIFEISKFYKKNQILKFQFIGLLFSLFILNLYLLYFYKSTIGFFFHLFGVFGIILTLINIFNYLYKYKINWSYIYILLVLFIVCLVFLSFRFYLNHTVLDSDIAPFVTNNNKSLSYFKLVLQFIATITIFYFSFQCLKKTDKEFYYHRVLRKWIYLFLVFIILFSLITIVVLIEDLYRLSIYNIYNYDFGLIAQEFLYLFVLFRPKYLDSEEIKYSISDIMNMSNKKGLKQIVNYKFFLEKYYLSPNASLTDFAILIDVDKDVLNDYFKIELNKNFIELVNNSRLDHFIALINQDKHKEFTIEALSMQCGFGTRQSLYQTFKKVKGCSPTDYILSITK